MFYVVSYDIADDRRRSEVHDTLKNYGTRVQFSVFECHLESAQLLELRERLATRIVPKEDNLRYYRLCRDCLEQTVVVGERPLTIPTIGSCRRSIVVVTRESAGG